MHQQQRRTLQETSTTLSAAEVLAAAKRFFSAADLDRLFAREDWHPLGRREVTIHRYEQPKVAWEVALAKA